MARKRKKIRKPRVGSSTLQVRLSLEELEAQSRNLSQAGKYKDAVATLKVMLQQEQRPEWIEFLAEAYVGRARGLADKGMFKEAAVIWRNRAESCDRFLAEPTYIELLFQSGQVDLALQLVQAQRKQIEEQGYLPGLRVLCALQVLAGQEALLDIFPGDDPLCRDFPAALAALQAYCGGEDAEMERQLKAIPFRSPFRDFRQILKALSLLDRDATGAEGLLDRIDAGSPFHPLSRTIKASQSPGPEFLLRYQGMGTAERHFVTTLKGWSAEQLRLAQELYQLGERPNVDRLLRFLLRNKEILGGEYVRGIAMRILVSYPRGKATYSKSLGRLSRFHQDRIAALRMEADAPPGEIFNAWSDLCLILNEQELPQDPESTLSKALILRRMTRQWLRSGPANPPALEALESALRCDPDDQPGYLELIRLYRGKGKLKDARRLLDEALLRYPEDSAVLTEAVETAIASSAFKKAARYARRALELDPINPRVRDILLNSHLAHARKQIRQKKILLARREIEEAANWARTEEAQGRIALTRGMLELSDHDRAAAQSCFLSGFERTGGGLVGRFQLLMEAARMGRPMATVLKQARLPRPHGKPTRKQVLALIHALGESVDEDEGALFEAVAFMEGPLKSAARLDFSLAEMERLCEAWLRLELSELRIPYARAALKRWPDTPVFIFHQIEAIREETFNPIPFEDREWLEEASERANAEGDTRTAHRISELLSEGLPFIEPDDEPFDPFGFDGGPGGLPNVGRIIDMIMGNNEAGEREPERVDRLIEEILEGTYDPGRQDDILSGKEQPKPRKKPRKKKIKDNDPDQFDLF